MSVVGPRAFGAGIALAACLFAVALPSSAYAQAGGLDTSFGGSGKVTSDLTARGDFAAAIAVQPDGKIVVAGGAAWDGANPKFGLIRYMPGGTLDTSFGGGDGRVLTDFTAREDAAYGVVIQSDGKVVAAGDAGLGTGDSSFAIARYDSDGTLDTTFSGDGKVMTQFTRRDDPVAGLALQSDGKIVVSGGAADNSSNPKFAVARYTTAGRLDDTYGGDGKVTTDLTPGRDFANAVVVDADNKIVAGGLASPGSSRANFALVRYQSGGALDPTFSNDGKVLTNFTRRDDSVQNLAFQGTNIIAAGIAGSGSSNAKFALARFTAAGALDLGFGGGDGKATTDFTGGYDAAFDVALQGDSKIVVGGEASGSGGRFALARYRPGGGLDGTFGGDGRVTTNFTPQLDFAFGVALDADGKIVLAGGSGWGGSNPKVALARYLAG